MMPRKQMAMAAPQPSAPATASSAAPAVTRSAGNRAMTQLFRMARSDAGPSRLPVSRPGDTAEREADAVASRIMGGPTGPAVAPTPVSPAVQRKCASCDQDEVRRQERAGGADVATANVQPAIDSPARPLDAGTRAFFGPHFGFDLSAVRLHTDGTAARSARSLNAHAYTVGSHIVMGDGEYAPETPAGRRLLAHELAHVAQQTGDGGLAVAPMVQRDWMDDAIDTAGDAYDSVTGAAGQAYDAVADGVQGAASETAKALGLDAEKQKSDLVGKVQAARQQAGQIDPAAELTAEQVAPINAKIAEANTLAPLVFPALQWAGRAAVLVGEFLTGLVEALLSAAVADVLVVVIIVVALLALLYLLYRALTSDPGTQAPAERQANPETRPEIELPFPFGNPPKPKTDNEPAKNPELPPKTDEEPADSPKADREPAPRPQVPSKTEDPPDEKLDEEPAEEPDPEKEPEEDWGLPCLPTGLTPLDPIPIVWFKPQSDLYYPHSIVLGGVEYDRDNEPSHLPNGEPIGVEPQFWPHVGKIFQLIPEPRGKAARDFKEVLRGYGFDWRGFQPDHVQDVMFEGPDNPINLWPMDATANMSAGSTTNGQRIAVCVGGPTDPAPIFGTLSQLKDLVYGRYFVIRAIQFAP